MSDTNYPYHERLTLKNFTAFSNETLEFVPGINVLIGENGTGKTHIMKALYAWQIARHLAVTGQTANYDPVFSSTYGVQSVDVLIRGKSKFAIAAGKFGDSEWEVNLRNGHTRDEGDRPQPPRPVFLPAIEMMAHARNMGGIMRDYADFDRTCFDFLAMVTSQRLRNGNEAENTIFELEGVHTLKDLVPGRVEWNEEEQRFYLYENSSRLPFALVAEGARKVSALYRLMELNWIRPGGVLFWDEPEVNINPRWMDEIVETIVAIAGGGVQVFLATHDYVTLKQINLTLRELKLRTGSTVPSRFFSLYKERGATKATSEDNFASLKPNSILDQFDQMLSEDWHLQDREDEAR